MKDSKHTDTRRWLARLTFGGMLLGTTATSCEGTLGELGAGLLAGVSSTIINQFVSDTIYGFFNASGGSF